MNNNVYAVVLVGGSGTRFWPLSRKSQPKQFLNIYGKQTLFEETLNRLSSKINPKNIFVVSNIAYKKAVKAQSKRFSIPPKNFLFEPVSRNTAPAICWAAQIIQRKDPQAMMAIFPSDHLIDNKRVFGQAVDKALTLAKANFLVTWGIRPTRPETGYGYLQTEPKRVQGRVFLKVKKFTEKPFRDKAVRFMKQGNYFWNGGMFVWKASVILEEFKRYQPTIYRYFINNSHRRQTRNQWQKLPSISVDYGILEKSHRVACIAVKDLRWSDLGSWEALHEAGKKDKKGNIFRGDIIPLECRNTLAWGEDRLVAAIGLENMLIVDTSDALLVCRRDLSQRVKGIVEILEKKNRKEYLHHSRSS